MKVCFKSYAVVVFATIFFAGCGGGGVDKPQIDDINITVDTVDLKNNEGIVKISVKAKDYIDSKIYDSKRVIELYDGTIENGSIKLESGKHLIKVCLINEGGETCSDSKPIYITKNITLDSYTKYQLEEASSGLDTDGNKIIYGTDSGKIYFYDIENNNSSLIIDTEDGRIGGVSYIDSNRLLYSLNRNSIIKSIKLDTEEIENFSELSFPDGLDYYDGKIYSVTYDRSGILTIFNLDGAKIDTLNTGIDDITGITHTQKYLYILSEDGHIYQTDPKTGHSEKIFVNDNLFEMGNNNNGLEAITILNNKIYVSYINDESLYLIDIDLSQYE